MVRRGHHACLLKVVFSFPDLETNHTIVKRLEWASCCEISELVSWCFEPSQALGVTSLGVTSLGATSGLNDTLPACLKFTALFVEFVRSGEPVFSTRPIS